LEKGSRRMESRFAAHAPAAKGHDIGGRLHRDIEKLDVDVRNAITDFGFGVAGGERL
jgi:hypothetical protein